MRIIGGAQAQHRIRLLQPGQAAIRRQLPASNWHVWTNSPPTPLAGSGVRD